MFIDLKKMSETKFESGEKQINNIGKCKYLSKYKNYLHIILDFLKDNRLFNTKRTTKYCGGYNICRSKIYENMSQRMGEENANTML